MSQHVPSGKLIDIDDSSFEDLHDDSITELNAKPHQPSKGTSDDDSVPTFDVSFSTAQYESRWSRSASVGGTILNDPAFKSDFNGDYILWSRVSEQNKKLSSSSLTSSIVNIIGGNAKADPKSSKYSLDHLLSSEPHESPDTASRPLTGKMANNSKYRSSEWSMNSLANNPTEKDRHAAYGETQRLVDGSSTRLMANDDEDYDSDGFGYRGRSINGDIDGANSKSGQCNWGLYKGIFYSSLSSVFFSLSAVIVKYLKDIHPGQLAVCRFVGIFVLTIPLIVYHDLNPFGPPELRHLLILRGLAGATSLFLRFVAFQNLPIADASVIIFSIPVFVSVFAWIFLKEPCGLFQSLTIVIAMIGLMMTTKLPFLFGGDSSLLYPSNTYYLYNSMPAVSASAKLANLSSLSNVSTSVVNSSAAHQAFKQLIQPPSQATAKLNHFYGVLAAMSSLIFASAVFIFIRKAKGAHYAVIMFQFGAVAIIETTILTTVLQGFSLPASPFEWYLIVILGVFSFCGQILLTRSLQLEQAGPVSVVRATTDIALAFLWQVIIFKESPDLWSIFGALLVSSCILLTSLRKWVLSLPDHSRLKAKFYFLSL